MSRTVYVNGAYVPEEEATISVFDRGFLFADGVYEVTSVIDGKLVDFPGHLARLHRSLGELEMQAPASDAEIEAVHRELVARNAVAEGMIYLQVTRGAADRDFAYPVGAKPGFVAFTQARPVVETASARDGIRVISVPDIRWARRDIKTVQLLPNLLAKTEARKAGAYEAWLVDGEGFVTEGASTNAWIVDADNHVVTRQLSHDILPGVTRRVILEAAAAAGQPIVERKFTVAEALSAREAFLSSATGAAIPVVKIDGAQVGDGTPGPLTRRIHMLYAQKAGIE